MVSTTIDKRLAVNARRDTPADVIYVHEHARGLEHEVAVRGGGHSVAGMSMNDGGMVIDVRPVKVIRGGRDEATARTPRRSRTRTGRKEMVTANARPG